MHPTPWRAVLLSWAAARVVVLVALFFQHERGLLGWDARWYRDIANHGYAGVPAEGIRFFPALPLVARTVSLGHDAGPALLVLANGSALLAAVLTYRLALRLGLGDAAGRRAVWVLALAPASYVLVMGYTEGPFLALFAGLLLLALDGRWLAAVPVGLAVGALRPTGLLVAIPLVLLAGRSWRAVPAVLAPLVGCAAYLAWVGARFGDPLLPYRAQSVGRLRGGVAVWPFTGDWWLHVPVAAAAVVLLVVCLRRLPAALSAYAVVALALAGTARALSSLDRYALATLPLVLAAGLVLGRPRLRRTAAVLAPFLLGGSAALAFAVGTTP